MYKQLWQAGHGNLQSRHMTRLKKKQCSLHLKSTYAWNCGSVHAK